MIKHMLSFQKLNHIQPLIDFFILHNFIIKKNDVYYIEQGNIT